MEINKKNGLEGKSLQNTMKQGNELFESDKR